MKEHYGEAMKWKYVLSIDLLYTFMLILVMNWFYSRTVDFLSGYAPHIPESILVVVLMIIFYLLLAFNVIKAYSE